MHGIGEKQIPARIAPDDFPGGLPAIPPTPDETYQLLELWDNVTGIARLRGETWGSEERCEYMVWMIDDGSQYRVIWDDTAGEFSVHRRR